MRFYNQLQIVGIIIVIILYFILPDTKEGFQSLEQVPYQVLYPNLEEIQRVITSKSYFKLFKDLDFKVRDCPPVISYCQKKYHYNVSPLTYKEQEKFDIFYKDIIEIIPKNQRKNLLRSQIKMAKTRNLENKFPHTHQDMIFFDESYYKKLLSYEKGKLKEFDNEASTLIHEITHLKQRDTPQGYDSLYRQWGFQPISYQYMVLNFPDHIIRRIRLNPDELPHYRFWVWKNKIIPLVLYESSRSYQISDVIYIGLKWDEKHDQVRAEYDPLDEFSDYEKYFGISNNHYHPLEIHAEYQSLLFLEILDNLKSARSPGYLDYLKTL